MIVLVLFFDDSKCIYVGYPFAYFFHYFLFNLFKHFSFVSVFSVSYYVFCSVSSVCSPFSFFFISLMVLFILFLSWILPVHAFPIPVFYIFLPQVLIFMLRDLLHGGDDFTDFLRFMQEYLVRIFMFFVVMFF